MFTILLCFILHLFYNLNFHYYISVNVFWFKYNLLNHHPPYSSQFTIMCRHIHILLKTYCFTFLTIKVFNPHHPYHIHVKIQAITDQILTSSGLGVVRHVCKWFTHKFKEQFHEPKLINNTSNGNISGT